jgi:hypothetical protein
VHRINMAGLACMLLLVMVLLNGLQRACCRLEGLCGTGANDRKHVMTYKVPGMCWLS